MMLIPLSVEEINTILIDIPILRGVQGEDVGEWLDRIEAALLEHHVPRRQWPDSVISHLSPDTSLKVQMHEQRSLIWELFKDVLTKCHRKELDKQELASAAVVPVNGYSVEDIKAQLASLKEKADKLREEHPTITKVAGVVLMVAGTPILISAAEASLLLAVGFGPLGPIAGTLAPWIQSIVYGARTGGIFSSLQAAGMTIAAPSAVATAAAAAAATVGGWFGFARPPQAPDRPSQAPDPPPASTSSTDNSSSPGRQRRNKSVECQRHYKFRQ